MSYTPINWQTGDTITAAKLNRCDNGWAVESTQLFSETVVTEDTGDGFYGASLVYSGVISVPELTITFDGADYTCQAIDDVFPGEYFYGGIGQDGPDFSVYPFALDSGIEGTDENFLFTETSGTHTILARVSAVDTSSDFESAVSSCVDLSTSPFKCVVGATTYDEMSAASSQGRILYFYYDDGCYFISHFTQSVAVNSVHFYPEADNVFTAGFDSSYALTVYVQ